MNYKDEDGITFVHIAAGLENYDILDYLLNHGAWVDSQTFEGLTPLHIAAMWGRSHHVATLLHYEADQSCLDVHGFSALMYAQNSVEEGSQNCVDLLLAHQEKYRLSHENELLPQNSTIKIGQRTPESEIDLDKLNDSPWITPRRESKKKLSRRNRKARGETTVNNEQFLNKLEYFNNDESTFSNVVDQVENLTSNSDQVLCFEELLTELSSNLLSSSGQDSSKGSNASTFSYSTITCLDSLKLASLSSVECSEYRTLYGSGFLNECSQDEMTEKGNNDAMGVDKCGSNISIMQSTSSRDKFRDITEMTEGGECAYETAIEGEEEVKEHVKQNRNDMRENGNLRKVSNFYDKEAVGNVKQAINDMKQVQIRSHEDAEGWKMKNRGNTEKIMCGKIQKVREGHLEMKNINTLGEEMKTQDVQEKLQDKKEATGLFEIKNGNKKECSKSTEAEKIEIYKSISEDNNDDNDRNGQETGYSNDVFNNFRVTNHNHDPNNIKDKLTSNEHKPFENSLMPAINNPGVALNSTFLVDSTLNHVSKQSCNLFIPFSNDAHSIHKAKTSTTTVHQRNKCEETIIYDWRDLTIDERNETIARIPPSYKKISCNELRKKIEDHGQIPGPITPQTKMLYVKKLWKLDQGLGKRDAKVGVYAASYTCFAVEGKNHLPNKSISENVRT